MYLNILINYPEININFGAQGIQLACASNVTVIHLWPTASYSINTAQITYLDIKSWNLFDFIQHIHELKKYLFGTLMDFMLQKLQDGSKTKLNLEGIAFWWERQSAGGKKWR